MGAHILAAPSGSLCVPRLDTERKIIHMEYCDACQRHLNGAQNCPGCGVAYGARNQDDPGSLKDIAAPYGKSERTADPAVVMLAGDPRVTRGRRNRRPQTLTPRFIGLTALVVCCAAVALVASIYGNAPEASAGCPAAVDNSRPDPYVGREGDITDQGLSSQVQGRRDRAVGPEEGTEQSGAEEACLP